MKEIAISDPIHRLSRSERRRWRVAARRAERDHDAEQLDTLREMAAMGCGVTVMTSSGSASHLTDTVEMIIEGRRVRLYRAPRRTLNALKEALSTIATVPLATASRYGPYWVLTFKTAAEPLVVLVDRITILPDWGGGFAWGQVPSGPVLQLAH